MSIAFIPVRGGSKSIPLKNIMPFCGKPLVYWTARAMEDAEEISKIIIATDSEEIRKEVLSFGFSKLEVYDRDPENAMDGSSTEDVMLEYLNKVEPSGDDFFVLVQATNPFITSLDISKAFSILNSQKADSLLTCVRFKRFFWTEDGKPVNYNYMARPRRQDFDGILMENGAFYISKIKDLVEFRNRLSGKIAIYEMPEYTAYETDEPDDWSIMEQLFYKYNQSAASGNPKKIKLFLSDVDGVMTDAGMYYSENGEELKKFNTHDGMAFQLLREAGIKTGIITTENTKLVERRAKKLKVDYLYQGKGFGSKIEAAREICQIENISLDEVAYIGDDINCLNIFEEVGIKACPSNSTTKVMAIKNVLKLKKAGGEGAVREFVEWLFDNDYVVRPAERC